MAEAPEYVYLLELSLDGVKPDGGWHRLKVEVHQRGVRVQARKGYAAAKKEK